jgi:CheY-like chemotaxis protein
MTNESCSTIGAPGSPAVVLHIDDDANDIELLRAAARRASFPLKLEHAEDGEQAMHYLTSADHGGDTKHQRLPTLILVDLKLPRITGLEIVEWVRSHPQTRHIPIVVLSGSELSSDMQRAYDAGANSYMVKPLEFDGLVRLVNQVVGRWCRVETPLQG